EADATSLVHELHHALGDGSDLIVDLGDGLGTPSKPGVGVSDDEKRSDVDHGWVNRTRRKAGAVRQPERGREGTIRCGVLGGAGPWIEVDGCGGFRYGQRPR